MHRYSTVTLRAVWFVSEKTESLHWDLGEFLKLVEFNIFLVNYFLGFKNGQWRSSQCNSNWAMFCHITHFYVLCNSDQMKKPSFQISPVKCPVTSGKTAIFLQKNNVLCLYEQSEWIGARMGHRGPKKLQVFIPAKDCSRLFHRLALHQPQRKNESPGTVFGWIENLQTLLLFVADGCYSSQK